MREVYVETGARMAHESGAAVWSFDLDLWGTCVQATRPREAVAQFERRHGPVVVREVVHGDERAFARDREPASDEELRTTLAVLTALRPRTVALARDLPDAVLDLDDPDRPLPGWARWRTVRAMLWHIADTESRYYLPCLGLPAQPRAQALVEELHTSHRHVLDVLGELPPDLAVHGEGEWTSTKLLRRLAWHEAGELRAIEDLLRSRG